jgi:hypothetical protein
MAGAVAIPRRRMGAPVIPRHDSRERDVLASANRQLAGAEYRVVRNVSDLERFANLTTIMLTSYSVELQFEAVRSEDLLRWQADLNRQLKACGCKSGGLLASMALTAYVVYLVLHLANLATWTECTVGLGVVVVAGAVGKLLGLVHARSRLRKTIYEVRTAIESSVSEPAGRGNHLYEEKTEPLSIPLSIFSPIFGLAERTDWTTHTS